MMRMIKAIVCPVVISLTFMLPAFLSAQDLVVVRAKKAFLGQEKIKAGDRVSYSQTVSIGENGILELSGIAPKTMSLFFGIHQIGEKHMSHLEGYEQHVAVYNQMKMVGIADCEFDYELYCVPKMGGFATFELGQIEVEWDTLAAIQFGYPYFAAVNPDIESSVLLKWNNPDTLYTGKYYVLVENFFAEYCELLETSVNQYEFNFASCSEESTAPLLFTIIAEDCRKSEEVALRFTSD